MTSQQPFARQSLSTPDAPLHRAALTAATASPDAHSNVDNVNTSNGGFMLYLTSTEAPPMYNDYDYGYNTQVKDTFYNNMEIAKEYIKDYDAYKNVMSECNATIARTPYPDDGK